MYYMITFYFCNFIYIKFILCDNYRAAPPGKVYRKLLTGDIFYNKITYIGIRYAFS